jgi:cation:H+ antiporter
VLRVWVELAVCAALIWVAGVRLSRYGDVLAERTGLGRSWIGFVLLAIVTSLPELITGGSAVALAGTPNIAFGDALGSCVFNLLIIVVLDFFQPEGSVFTRASQGHVMAGAFGVVLIGFVGFNLLLAGAGRTAAFGHVAAATPVIIVIYAVAARTVFRYEKRQVAAAVEQAAEVYAHVTLRRAVIGCTVAALAVVAIGLYLPFVGERLAELMGWRQTFVGTLFVAAATSAPEAAVSIAAVRMGALDMAVANLLGSNLFNMLVIAIDDLLYVKGPLFAHVAPMHAASAFSAIMMTGIGIVALVYRPPSRLFNVVGSASLLLLAIYVLNTYVLYLFGQ